MKLGNVNTGKHIACVDWAHESYGFICVGFYPSNLSAEHFESTRFDLTYYYHHEEEIFALYINCLHQIVGCIFYGSTNFNKTRDDTIVDRSW